MTRDSVITADIHCANYKPFSSVDSSGELAANLGYNPELIAAAVVQTKALGTTLEQTKAQGDALLNFESSYSMIG